MKLTVESPSGEFVQHGPVTTLFVTLAFMFGMKVPATLYALPRGYAGELVIREKFRFMVEVGEEKDGERTPLAFFMIEEATGKNLFVRWHYRDVSYEELSEAVRRSNTIHALFMAHPGLIATWVGDTLVFDTDPVADEWDTLVNTVLDKPSPVH
jgi:hypothetical protein